MNRKKVLSWVGTAAFLVLALICSPTPAASVVFLLGCALLVPLEQWQILLKEKLELFGSLKIVGVVVLLVLGIVLTQTTKPVETVAETPTVAVPVSVDEETPRIEETIEPESTPEPEATPEPEDTPEPAATPEREKTPEPSPEPTPESTPAPEPTPTPTPTPEAENSAIVEPTQADYVLNTNSKKFHIPSCSSVNKMKESNKVYFTGTRDEVITQGYSPCGNCKP